MNTLKVEEKLIENVANYPHNLAAAFRLTSRQTKEKVAAIRTHYYRHVRPKTPLFFIKTANGLAINSKVFTVKKETPRTLTLKGKLINIDDMSDGEKVDFFNLIFQL